MKQPKDIKSMTAEQAYAEGLKHERKRIERILKRTIVESVKWQQVNRFWNDGDNEWNGGQDSDNKYLQSVAGYLLAKICDEAELIKPTNGETE